MKMFITPLYVVLFILPLVSCSVNEGSVSLVNATNEPISRGTVYVCRQTIELTNIPPMKSAIGSYKVKSDSHYIVMIEFRSGKKLGKELGYVTNGLDFHDSIVVTDTDIVMGERVKQ